MDVYEERERCLDVYVERDIGIGMWREIGIGIWREMYGCVCGGR